MSYRRCPPRCISGAFPSRDPARVYVLLDPSGYVAHEGDAALPADEVLRRTIFLCAEATAVGDGRRRHMLCSRSAGAVFALDQRSVVALHRPGIPARLIRPGYSESLDRFDPQAPRPIDVDVPRHAQPAADQVSEPRRACALRVTTACCRSPITRPTAGDTSSPLAQGRWPLLAQTKVLISLHRETSLGWTGAVRLTRCTRGRWSSPSPRAGSRHWYRESICWWRAPTLSPTSSRLCCATSTGSLSLRSAAYERLSSWVPYALPVAVLRAAVVELVGEPVPSGTPWARFERRRRRRAGRVRSGGERGFDSPAKLLAWRASS